MKMKIQHTLPFIKLAVEEKRLILDETINTFDFVSRECLICRTKENLDLIILEQDKRLKDSNYDYSFHLCEDCNFKRKTWTL